MKKQRQHNFFFLNFQLEKHENNNDFCSILGSKIWSFSVNVLSVFVILGAEISYPAISYRVSGVYVVWRCVFATVRLHPNYIPEDVPIKDNESATIQFGIMNCFLAVCCQ